MENDPCKFALTSRTGDMVETFILHSSSPSVRQTWIHEINQILENQRNFLNGDVSSYRLCRLLSLTQVSVSQHSLHISAAELTVHSWSDNLWRMPHGFGGCQDSEQPLSFQCLLLREYFSILLCIDYVFQWHPKKRKLGVVMRM